MKCQTAVARQPLHCLVLPEQASRLDQNDGTGQHKNQLAVRLGLSWKMEIGIDVNQLPSLA